MKGNAASGKHKSEPQRETSLVVQWIRIHLAMQGRQVWSLVREQSFHMTQATTEPVHHSYRVRELQWKTSHEAMKTPHATTKTRYSQINNIKRKRKKTTLRDDLVLIRMVVIRKIRDNKCWQECGDRRPLGHYWWGCKLVQPLWKRVWRFLKKRKIEPPYAPATPLLEIK